MEDRTVNATIDRFEDGNAVCETERGMAVLPKALVPPGAKEGDILSIFVDQEATKTRRFEIETQCKDLWE